MTGGGRGAATLTGAICAIAVLVYASHVPRDGITLLGTPEATGQSAPAGPASPGVVAARPATPADGAGTQVDLSVVVWPRGPGRGRVAWSVTCPPMTSACRTAARRWATLASEGGGPCRPMRSRLPEAMITGYVNGRYVAAWVDQRDGCGLVRWTSLAALLKRPARPPSAPSAPGAPVPAPAGPVRNPS